MISPWYILLAVTLFVGYLYEKSLSQIILYNFIFYCIVYWKEWKNVLLTFKRDITGMYIVIVLQRDIGREMRQKSTIATIFQRFVSEHPHKAAFIDVENDRTWTFVEFDQFTNQIANYLHESGVKAGDVVALFMTNCVKYVAFWLAISKLGAVASLINYNLRLKSLGHCVSLANCKFVIVGSDLQFAISEAVDNEFIDKRVKVFVYGNSNNGVTENFVGVNITDELLKRKKLLPVLETKKSFTAKGSQRSLGIRSDEIIYVTMALYHGGAGMVAVGQTLINGCTCVIRKKFSATRYWDDCVKYKCTSAHYIGEICRYLLAQSPTDSETRHSVRLIFGNGLRIQIWKQFVARFRIKQVGEFYGSTEGNTSLVNMDNQVGACGFFPIAVVYPIFSAIGRRMYPITLIKVDEDTGEIVRNKNGLCIRCTPGQYGEIVGKIIKGNPLKEFVGYLSKEDTNKKLIPDVFEKGDMAFSSGDILYMDEKGYLYFKDRTGDTFRWKGENVSTTEVEGVIQNIVGLKDTCVYGVKIPGMEGKAGMAAIAVELKTFDLNLFSKRIRVALPSYAAPIFLRICKTIEFTGTYKLIKDDLIKRGFVPSQHSNDQIFYMDPKSCEYTKLTLDIYHEILNGFVKL